MVVTISEKEMQTLINENINLVRKIANNYAFNGFSKEYLIEVGTTGIYEAAIKFDSSKGVKFSTFAYDYIKGAILNEIRLNSNLNPKYGLVKKIKKQLEPTLGLNVSANEIANASEGRLTGEEVEEILVSSARALSFNTANDDELSLEELTPSQDNPADTYSLVDNDENMRQMIYDYCQILDKDEFLVFSYHTGLNDYPQLKDNEIAKAMQINVNRVNTLYKHALEKLRKIVAH